MRDCRSRLSNVLSDVTYKTALLVYRYVRLSYDPGEFPYFLLTATRQIAEVHNGVPNLPHGVQLSTENGAVILDPNFSPVLVAAQDSM